MASKNPARIARMTSAQLKDRELKPKALLRPMHSAASVGLDLPFLGHPRAVVIVTMAARTSPTNLPRSLAQLGVNGVAFQKAVFQGVVAVGYRIAMDAIPNAPANTLIQVVTVIQNAPHA